MKQIIEEYQDMIQHLKGSLDTIDKMLKASDNDSSIDYDDLIEEQSNCESSIRIYSKFIKDIKNCETLILIDNIIDVFDHNPCSTTGFSMITIETCVLEKLKDISKSIK